MDDPLDGSEPDALALSLDLTESKMAIVDCHARLAFLLDRRGTTTWFQGDRCNSQPSDPDRIFHTQL